MKWYWIITIPVVISYYIYIYLSEREIGMKLDPGMVALIVAIVGLIGSTVGNIVVNYKGWKSSEKLIGNSKSNKTLTAMFGNDGADRVSLSDEHKELKEAIKSTQNDINLYDMNLNQKIKEYQIETENLIKPNNELLVRIDERQKNAEALQKMREDLLTPSQLAIKNSIDNLTAMSDNWQKNNAELISYKTENHELQLELLEKDNIIEQKNKEISRLQKELTNIKQNLEQKNYPSPDIIHQSRTNNPKR